MQGQDSVLGGALDHAIGGPMNDGRQEDRAGFRKAQGRTPQWHGARTLWAQCPSSNARVVLPISHVERTSRTGACC